MFTRYSPEHQALMAENVFLTGGNLMYPGVKERVERELLAMRPFQSQFKVLTHKYKYTLIHKALEKVKKKRFKKKKYVYVYGYVYK